MMIHRSALVNVLKNSITSAIIELALKSEKKKQRKIDKIDRLTDISKEEEKIIMAAHSS